MAFKAADGSPPKWERSDGDDLMIVFIVLVVRFCLVWRVLV